MTDKFTSLPILTTEVKEINFPRAKKCLIAILNSPFCNLVSLNRIIEDKDILFKKEDEVIIFDTEVEVPQYPKNDIKKKERIAAIFSKEDNNVPWVFALRSDFPELIHQNFFFKGYPKSLCIYEKSFDEIKISWSSSVFIEDIRTWLKLTAKGILHQEEQQLEPLVIFYDGDIILPHDIKPKEKLFAYGVKQKDNKLSIITRRQALDDIDNIGLRLVYLIGKPQTHGVIRDVPISLEDLSSFLSKAQIDFKTELISALKENKVNSADKFLFLIFLPKKRDNESTEIGHEIHAYATIDSIKDIGSKIGLWEEFEKKLCDLWGFKINEIKLDEIQIGLLKPHFTFNAKLAAKLNNFDEVEKTPNILAIGMGSLGSQIFMNLARSGFGKWSLIDNDIFLPHNLARHSLNFNHITIPKVNSLSLLANEMLSDNSFSHPLQMNIIKQSNENETKEIKDRTKECDLIFDFSASISVPRYLSKNDLFSTKRILSSFLSPEGNYCVILFEDKDKNITVDILEMLFYRELITKESLKNYFSYDEKGEVRYSTSCRDLSSRIPQDYLSIHASVVSGFIKKTYDFDEAKASIMHYNNSEFNLSKHDISINEIKRAKISEWEVIYDKVFIDKVSSLRKKKLPKETGGILVGSWDVEYKKIYILDTIIPLDSSEYPTCFYRGVEGLQDNLENISKLTAGMLKYVGEWHSHPDGCPPILSKDDLNLLAWLTENMSLENLPSIMMIFGENQQYNLYLGSTID